MRCVCSKCKAEFEIKLVTLRREDGLEALIFMCDSGEEISVVSVTDAQLRLAIKGFKPMPKLMLKKRSDALISKYRRSIIRGDGWEAVL